MTNNPQPDTPTSSAADTSKAEDILTDLLAFKELERNKLNLMFDPVAEARHALYRDIEAILNKYDPTGATKLKGQLSEALAQYLGIGESK